MKEYAGYDQAATDAAMLHSILEGVLADGRVDQDEVRQLMQGLRLSFRLKRRTENTAQLMRPIVRLIMRSRLDRHAMAELNRYKRDYPNELDYNESEYDDGYSDSAA